ncbi:N-acetylglucosamine kinase [Sciscionella marina]|uniref:N-acetylglucosamine kinase n=1 Tax=Sciscionella marina TaxID=508770 RepID=UPI00038196B0|nr:BadF/BadG/BcrA/BcrD ATPase family protein [Sciscionella marina]
MNPLVVGIDAGGTSTRAKLGSLDGAVLGNARGEGSNPNSYPPEVAAGRIADTVRAALAEHDPGQVGAAVLGLAGDSKLVDPEIAAIFEKAWRSTGIDCELTVLSDVEIAFASATGAPSGTALVAGTGSIAVGVREHRKVRLAGGYGWLLGDEGSGFWLGREAIRACLDTLLRDDGELGPLARAVYEQAVGPLTLEHGFDRRRAQSSEVITAANADSPIRVARFAPLVSEAALAGDESAIRILDAAVEHLVRLAMTARGTDTGPVVLTGGLIGPGGPLTDRLRARLEAVTGTEPLGSGDGGDGAAWLAAKLLDDSAPHPVTG